MKNILLLASMMLMGGYCLAQNDYYQDSLQIEIGNRARIIFQAREKVDFELIKRYDLNKLFEELLLRAAAGDTATTDMLSLLESKKFANAQAFNATAKKVKEIFLRFNYGAYAGFAPGQNIQLPLTTHSYTIDELQGRILLEHRGTLQLAPALLTLGLSVDGGILLKNRPRMSTEFKLSLGYERTDFQKSFSRSVQYAFEGTRELNELETKALGLYYDKIAGGSNIGNSNNYQQFSQFYLQFMPQIELQNEQNKATWRFGLGIRGIANLRGQGRSFQWLSILDHPTRPQAITAPATLNSSPYLWGAVGRLSYKSIGIFVNYTPRALSITNSTSLEGVYRSNSTQYFNSWVFGLRWGIF